MILPFLAAFQLAAPVYSGRANQTHVAIPKVESSIEIDGVLSEPVWQQAARLTGFSLYTPVDNRPAPDSTDVLVWYSSDAIYFGIRAYAQPGTVAATLADRDRISADDNVEIHLDTFHERNRAFVFIVNPLGVQADGTKSEGGGFIPGSNVGPGQNDLSADFVWQSRGHVTEWGYEVEVRIPFSVLRYPNIAVQQWGLQIDRHVQRNGYEETWTPAIRASASFIAQAGTLDGLTGLHHGQIAELNPEVTNTTTGTPCCAPTNTGWSYTSNPQLGDLSVVKPGESVERSRLRDERLLAGRSRRDADRRGRALRALLRGEAAVLRRGHGSVQRAEHARVHAHDRATRRRRETHRQARTRGRGRAVGSRPRLGDDVGRSSARRHRAAAAGVRRAVAGGPSI
jgi:hypothetical protein